MTKNKAYFPTVRMGLNRFSLNTVDAISGVVYCIRAIIARKNALVTELLGLLLELVQILINLEL